MEQVYVRKLSPKMPDIETLVPDNLRASYDAESDSLYFDLYGAGSSGVHVLVDPDLDLYAVVDPESDEVVALEIGYFLKQFVREHPEGIRLAVAVGIDHHVIVEALASPSQHEQRRTISAFLEKVLDSSPESPVAAFSM